MNKIDETTRKILFQSSWTPERLREMRERLGLSQREVADIMGVTKTVVSGIELGRNIYGPAFTNYAMILERYYAYTKGYLPAFRKAGATNYAVLEV